MPETIRTSCGCKSRPASACLTAIRMAKSPQPGHQVDLSPPLKIFRSDTRHLPDAGPLAENVGDDLVWRDRSSVVLIDLPVGLPTGQPAQDVGKLASVVLLDDDHALDLVKLGGDAILVEREDVHEQEDVGGAAPGVEQIGGLAQGT